MQMLLQGRRVCAKRDLDSLRKTMIFTFASFPLPTRPRSPKRCPKSAENDSQRFPRGAQELPRSPQEALRGPQNHPPHHAGVRHLTPSEASDASKMPSWSFRWPPRSLWTAPTPPSDLLLPLPTSFYCPWSRFRRILISFLSSWALKNQ